MLESWDFNAWLAQELLDSSDSHVGRDDAEVEEYCAGSAEHAGLDLGRGC